jgi:hypothetical protein
MQLPADKISVAAVVGDGEGAPMAQLDNSLYVRLTPRARQVA